MRAHLHHPKAPGTPMSVKAITTPTSVPVGHQVATLERHRQPQQCHRRPPFHPCGNIGKATGAKNCIMGMVYLLAHISPTMFTPQLLPPVSILNWVTCCLCLVRTRPLPAITTPQPLWDLHRQPKIWGACLPANFNSHQQCSHSSTLVSSISEVPFCEDTKTYAKKNIN